MPKAALTMFGVRVRVVTQATLPYLLGKRGITIGSTIYLTGHALGIRPELLAHEYRHSLQWQEKGVLRFCWEYLQGLVKHGYTLKHEMEREAYDFAAKHSDAFRPFVAQIQAQIAAQNEERAP